MTRVKSKMTRAKSKMTRTKLQMTRAICRFVRIKPEIAHVILLFASANW
jgi:hypothetical protein